MISVTLLLAISIFPSLLRLRFLVLMLSDYIWLSRDKSFYIRKPLIMGAIVYLKLFNRFFVVSLLLIFIRKVRLTKNCNKLIDGSGI